MVSEQQPQTVWCYFKRNGAAMRFEFELDDMDEQAVNQAIAYYKPRRVNGKHVLPESKSDMRGMILAEICRDWLEYKKRVIVKHETCPKCNGPVEMLHPDVDWCPNCYNRWPVT